MKQSDLGKSLDPTVQCTLQLIRCMLCVLVICMSIFISTVALSKNQWGEESVLKLIKKHNKQVMIVFYKEINANLLVPHS